MRADPDAVVIGAGPNGLVAANVLADVGGACSCSRRRRRRAARSAARARRARLHCRRLQLVLPARPRVARPARPRPRPLRPALGARPARARASAPRWLRAGRPRDPAATSASIDAGAPGDGAAWDGLYRTWDRAGDEVIAMLLPFPPIRHALRVARRLGPRHLLGFTRLSLWSLDCVAREFRGEGGRLLLGGNMAHTDLSVSALTWACTAGCSRRSPRTSASRSWRAVRAASSTRWSRSSGRAAGRAALRHACQQRDHRGHQRGRGHHQRRDRDPRQARRALGHVGTCAAPRPGRLAASRAVASPGAPAFPLGPRHGEGGLGDRRHDPGRPSPRAPRVRDPPRRLARRPPHRSPRAQGGAVPARPFLIVGQTTTADPTRSPAGTEAAWAYAHVPQTIVGDAGPDGIRGAWANGDGERFADRMRGRDRAARPGLPRRANRARHVLTPASSKRWTPTSRAAR